MMTEVTGNILQEKMKTMGHLETVCELAEGCLNCSEEVVLVSPRLRMKHCML